MKEKKLIFLHALTPLHVGTGQAVANVDLPIAREKATGFPIVPASAFKGVLRDHYSNNPNVSPAFGTTESAGSWMFTDLRILCLPVRSFYGVFAYVTCPLILSRLQRMVNALNIELGINSVTDVLDIEVSHLEVAAHNETQIHHENRVFLEDIDLSLNPNLADRAHQIAQTIAGWVFPEGERDMFIERFAIVSNETFSFLSETATEIVARVRLEDDVKTVAQGGLWYEETVPAEAIFYGFVVSASDAASLSKLQEVSLIQIGGDATIGRGICRVVIKP